MGQLVIVDGSESTAHPIKVVPRSIVEECRSEGAVVLRRRWTQPQDPCDLPTRSLAWPESTGHFRRRVAVGTPVGYHPNQKRTTVARKRVRCCRFQRR